ncbi:MAG: LPS export ABC transporter permease LptG [Pseudomonadota bacterium]|nr:LPS export ABC transporter permease LptG [Pseudomonadota bacterium]
MKLLEGVFTAYVGRQFLMRFLGLLAFFVIVLQMLDLLNESDEILSVDGANASSLLHYIWLRAPQIASQFAPFAALLAVVATLSLLNIRSEITVMRAAGLSVHRVLFPIGVVCAGVAVAHFAFHETLVVRATEKLAYWKANDYAVNLEPDTGTRADIRLAFDNELIHAESAARVGDDVRLNRVTINDLGPDGLIRGKTEARSALFEKGEWRLFGVRTYDFASLAVQHLDAAPWRTNLDPELLFALSLNPDRTPLPELLRKIGQLRADGADTRAATTSFLSRFSKPMATLVMPLLGAIAGFGISRQGNQLARAVVGSALGFSYFVGENLMLALGKLGVAPAMLGAFFPFALFMVVGFAILLAMEN